MEAAAELPAPEAVYKSSAILALVEDDVARYMARVTGIAEIDGVTLAVYDPTRCDWAECEEIPNPESGRFCTEHRNAFAERLRARLMADARASRERRRDLLSGLRRTAYEEIPAPRAGN